MVMMEKPSPIQVGREFVRQYYTLLNKAPALLHRFYNVNSSYVHGGKYCDGEPEEPIIGQTEIYHKIESLNFNDCHTKIRQVDALSTLANGVVVQVTGELSNGGQPLRRFMQTFVLAPQGDNPFKFYVRNDIFRYQDEVFSDSQGEPSDDEEQVVQVEEETENVEEGDDEGLAANSETTDSIPVYVDNPYTQTMPTDPVDQQRTLTNGLEQRTEVIEVDHKPSSPSNVEPEEPDALRRSPTPIDLPPDAESASPETMLMTDELSEVAIKEPDVAKPKQPVKPFSWADMASKNTPAPRTNVQQATVVKVNRPVEPPAEASDGADLAPRQQRAPRNTQRRDDDRGGGFEGRSERRGPGRDSMRFPDSQQIFVGNLPYDIEEGELRDHFAGFGQVLEVKINHSQTNNPSFGFVIFKDPKSVDSVLRSMPTQFKNNYRINIEEKKQRNNRDGNRRGGDPRRGGMGDNRGGRRGPPPPNVRRDRQGSREGQRPNGPRR